MRRAALLVFLFGAACHRSVQVAAPPNPAQSGWIDLEPAMQIRVQNAYYRDGAPRQGLEGYLGTETAHFEVRARGLRLLPVEDRLNPNPREQAPVEELLPAAHRGFAHYRFFYAVVFNHRGNVRGSVLIGAGSGEEIARLGERLVHDPDSVCGAGASRCTVFPEMCTVSIEIPVVVNSVARMVSWGSSLISVASGAKHVELARRGRAAVEIDGSDTGAMRTPLVAGDRIRWN